MPSGRDCTFTTNGFRMSIDSIALNSVRSKTATPFAEKLGGLAQAAPLLDFQ